MSCDKCPHEGRISALEERDNSLGELLRRLEKTMEGLSAQVDTLTEELNKRRGAFELAKFIWPMVAAVTGGVMGVVGTLAVEQARYILHTVIH